MTAQRWLSFAACLMTMTCPGATKGAAASAGAIPAGPAPPASSSAADGGNTIDLATYRVHLLHLLDVVTRCEASPGPVLCDSRQAAGDDRIFVPGMTAPREVHYSWLADVLTSAAKPAAKPISNSAAKPAVKSGGEPARDKPAGDAASVAESGPKALLAAARQHLLDDLSASGASVTETAGIVAKLPSPSTAGSPAAAPDHSVQHQQVHAILSQNDFDAVQPPGPWRRALEAFLNWLNDRLSRVSVRHVSGWVTAVLEWGLVIATSTGLIWWLISGSKRERWRLEAPHDSREAPSLRDWQVWLAEAETFAGSGRWREAVHSVYWAAISRLESRGLWPVDRARTPREYIQLVVENDPRRSHLIALTRNFERIWYGHRDAAELDYRRAVQIVGKLTG